MQEEHESSGSVPGPEWAAPFALDEEALEAVNRGALSITSNYSQLDTQSRSIRLLTITWNQDLGEVECRTETCSLDDVPLYTALSYTWGRPDAGCKVILDGRTIEVTKNLRRFLRQVVRLPKYGSRRYWIDALCIDQSNAEERLHQVALMPAIYSTAATVVAWLGPSYSPHDTAMKTFRRPYKREIWPSPKAGEIRSFCERAYWSRLWVVQELYLAADIHILCGHDEIPWRRFTKYVLDAQSHVPLSKAQRTHLTDYEAFCKSPAVAMVGNVEQIQQPASLFDQVLAFQHLRCAELSDRVYALLGVAEATEDVPADYTLSMTTILHKVLRNHHSTVEPQNLDQVRDQCFSLCRAVGLSADQMLDSVDLENDRGDGDATFKDIDCDAGRFTMLPWARIHAHVRVADLWLREIKDGLDFKHLFARFIETDQKDLVQTSIANSLICIDHSHLFLAILFRRKHIVSLLLQSQQVDVNGQDKAGQTPLMAAITVRDEDIVRLLLQDTRVDINKQGTRRHEFLTGRHVGYLPPLLAAIWDGCQIEIIDLLLEHPDLNINCKDDRGCTPIAAAFCQASIPVIKRLLKNKRVALGGACFSGGRGDSRDHTCSFCAGCLTAGVCSHCNYIPSVLCTAFEPAYNNRFYQALRTRPDLDVNTIDNEVNNIVKILLTRTDIDVNEGRPLHRAIIRGRLDIVEMFLKREDLSLAESKFSASCGWVEEFGTMLVTLKSRLDEATRLSIVQLLLESKKPIDLRGEIKAAEKLGFGKGPTYNLLKGYRKRPRSSS